MAGSTAPVRRLRSWPGAAAALLALAGLGLDALWRWSAANLKLRRMSLPAVVRWAVAWLGIGTLAAAAALSVIDLYGKNRPSAAAGAMSILSGLNVGDLLRTYAAQFPVLLGVGAALSILSLIGLLALIIADDHCRASRLETDAVYAEGVLRPVAPLDIPDGTRVQVAFDVTEDDAILLPGEALLSGDETAVPVPAVAAAGSVGQSAASAPVAFVTDLTATDSVYTLPQATPAQIAGRRPGSAVSTSADPWKLPIRQASFLLLFALTIGVVLFLRFFKLDTLQREIYGDIIIVRNYVQGVLLGHWPTRFDLSAGPLYHYLITPIVAVAGLDYAGLKLASVFVSLGVLAATYAFCRRLVNDYFALLATFIAGVSSWLLIFSRLGNSHIVLPLLTATALWLVVRVVQFDRQSDLIACAIVSSLGLYVYPQSFVLPGVIFLTLLLLRWTGLPVASKKLGLFALVALVCAIPFVFIVRTDPANFTGGYIGSKIKTDGDFLTLLGQSVGRALLAFHVRGDGNFRSNPSGLTHLDWISGVLFLAGIVYWLTTKERRRWIPIWLVPLLLLQIPSILALNQPA